MGATITRQNIVKIGASKAFCYEWRSIPRIKIVSDRLNGAHGFRNKVLKENFPP